MQCCGERTIAGVPVIVVELPRVHVPLPIVGVPVHVHDAVGTLVPRAAYTTTL